MLKKRTYHGYVSPLVDINSVISVNTEGGFDFLTAHGPFRDMGTVDDWGKEEWPPQKISITIEIHD